MGFAIAPSDSGLQMNRSGLNGSVDSGLNPPDARRDYRSFVGVHKRRILILIAAVVIGLLGIGGVAAQIPACNFGIEACCVTLYNHGVQSPKSFLAFAEGG